MKKSKTKYVHVRLDEDLEYAFTVISEERGRLSEIVNYPHPKGCELRASSRQDLPCPR